MLQVPDSLGTFHGSSRRSSHQRGDLEPAIGALWSTALPTYLDIRLETRQKCQQSQDRKRSGQFILNRLFGLRDGVRIEGKTKNKKLAKRFKEKQRLKKTIA